MSEIGFDGPLGERCGGGGEYSPQRQVSGQLSYGISCVLLGGKARTPGGAMGMLKAKPSSSSLPPSRPPCPELAKDRDQLPWEERGLASCPLGLRLIF